MEFLWTSVSPGLKLFDAKRYDFEEGVKYFDLHLLGIIGLVLVLSIILASDAFFGATQNAGQWEAILALLLLLFPQGRIVTRMGDLKKMGHSGWSRLTYLIISEAMVLLAVITYTLVNAR